MIRRRASGRRSGRSSAVRGRRASATATVDQPGPTDTSSVERPRRVGLVGCVKRKRYGSWPAADLYSSALFAGRRRYVEATCSSWWILSALHGVVHPDEIIGYYDVTLSNMGVADRRKWARRVLAALDDISALAPGDLIELHCGAPYRDFGLVDGLIERGCIVENPTVGMPIGQQLSFYKNANP